MVADFARITRRPHPDGVEACIRDTNINVWGLVEWRRLGRTDAEILESIPRAHTGRSGGRVGIFRCASRWDR